MPKPWSLLQHTHLLWPFSLWPPVHTLSQCLVFSHPHCLLPWGLRDAVEGGEAEALVFFLSPDHLLPFTPILLHILLSASSSSTREARPGLPPRPGSRLSLRAPWGGQEIPQTGTGAEMFPPLSRVTLGPLSPLQEQLL